MLKHRSAFTLIEMLIVTAVFAVIFLVATTAFINIQTSQREVLARQRVVADGRYVLETIARTVRLSQISYSFYGNSVTNPQGNLLLTDQSGNNTCYHFDSDTNRIYVITDGTCTLSNTNPDNQNITPSDLVINNLTFTITPRSDPFAGPPTTPGSCKTGLDYSESGKRDGYDGSAGTCVCTYQLAAVSCFPDQVCNPTGKIDTNNNNYSICQNPNIQPSVTIVLHTSSTNTVAGEKADITLQTTSVSRVYLR